MQQPLSQSMNVLSGNKYAIYDVKHESWLYKATVYNNSETEFFWCANKDKAIQFSSWEQANQLLKYIQLFRHHITIFQVSTTV
ncbi:MULTISPECIES: hypothetical protein [Aerococcus]|uniref:KTSC domain-containing protein n=2 Tax=Aerococcus TaxID=1375 RepID=A0A1E9PJ47_9LACT|nr:MULTISPECIES: hypothetical protein [Aerococcus]MBU5611289.1 hypothetical protein [Aerococcus urinae]MCY3034002.1 hypothetical protein [Aerococcus mictus]MCY3065770.1 hypothetical protein [Aerococcus mictus]MCY3066474.1 hypothetical protein [Aerococcus mictus]MCY3071399.1 hypothetical protein [Aerococcus mictus]